MKKCLTIALMALSSLAHAQQWSGGIKVEIPTGATKTGNTFQVDQSRYDATSRSSADASNPRFGGFVRYDKPRWLAQAEVMTSKFGLATGVYYAGMGSLAPVSTATRTSLVVTGGYKPVPWLRLQAGVGLNQFGWKTDKIRENVAYFQRAVDNLNSNTDESTRADLTSHLAGYSSDLRLVESYKTTQLTGHYGIGVDLGGLTFDLSRTQGLTPILAGVAGSGQRIDAQQNYGYTSLSVGYRLFPLKKFLLATRKNRAYERVKKDIPFYRNEFQAGLGIQAEDFDAGVIYENRYTRYLTRRTGLTGSLGLARRVTDRHYFASFNPSSTIYLALMGRVLPLYTRRHQIALSAGPNMAFSAPAISGGGSQTGDPAGTLYTHVGISPSRMAVGYQWQFEYQLAATDHIPVGIWVRQTDRINFLGLQAGYRF